MSKIHRRITGTKVWGYGLGARERRAHGIRYAHLWVLAFLLGVLSCSRSEESPGAVEFRDGDCQVSLLSDKFYGEPDESRTDDKTYNPPVQFLLPDVAFVYQGGSGDGFATLKATIPNQGVLTVCYQGGIGTTEDPDTIYAFQRASFDAIDCDDVNTGTPASVQPFDVLTAERLQFEVHEGDSTQGPTKVAWVAEEYGCNTGTTGSTESGGDDDSGDEGGGGPTCDPVNLLSDKYYGEPDLSRQADETYDPPIEILVHDVAYVYQGSAGNGWATYKITVPGQGVLTLCYQGSIVGGVDAHLKYGFQRGSYDAITCSDETTGTDAGIGPWDSVAASRLEYEVNSGDSTAGPTKTTMVAQRHNCNPCGEHGQLDGETCVCDSGYTGPSCDIFEPECDPNDPDTCNGRGPCVDREVGPPVCDCDSGYVGAHCESNVRPLRKKINAPPGDFDLVSLGDPKVAGHEEVCSTRAIVLEDTGSACSWSSSVPLLLGSADITLVRGASTLWSLAATDPTSAAVNLSPLEPITTPEIIADSYEIDVQDPGSWTLTVVGDGACSGASNTEGYVQVCQEESNRAFFSYVDSHTTHVGDLIAVKGFVYQNSETIDFASDAGSIPSPVVGEITSLGGTLVEPDGASTSLMGTAATETGTYEVSFVPTQNGRHTVVVVASGTTSGAPFEYTTVHTVDVITSVLVFDAELDPAGCFPPSAGNPLTLEIPLDVVNVGTPEERERVLAGEYRISGEIWAYLRDGDFVLPEAEPVAWVSNLAAPWELVDPEGSGTFLDSERISVELRPEWIGNVKFLVASSGYVIDSLVFRNVRISEGKELQLQDTREEYPIGEEECFDWLATWLAAIPAAFTNWDDYPEMLNGAPPDFVADLEAFVEAHEFPALVGDLVLVHGYCDTKAAWSSGDFDNIGEEDEDTERVVRFSDWFSDPKREIETRKFADHLAAWLCANTAGGCPEAGNLEPTLDDLIVPAGIVGHSQGGMAALGMFSDTWTPLDVFRDLGSSSSQDHEFNLIQAVDSPFRGSGIQAGAKILGVPLVLGYERLLSKWLGGCTLADSEDILVLTYSKAHRYMKDIPKEPRKATWRQRAYHGTENGRRCNMADAFLPGKDDGAVSRSRQSTDEVNHYADQEGLCHANGMDYDDVRREFEITDKLCTHSFLGLVEPAVCPVE